MQALREAFPRPGLEAVSGTLPRNVLDQTSSGYRDRMHQLLDLLLKASSQKDMQRRFEEVSGEIEEIRRREKVIRIFLNIVSVERLIGVLCAETYEERSTGRRYLKMDGFLE